jgi:hypothetical protein
VRIDIEASIAIAVPDRAEISVVFCLAARAEARLFRAIRWSLRHKLGKIQDRRMAARTPIVAELLPQAAVPRNSNGGSA